MPDDREFLEWDLSDTREEFGELFAMVNEMSPEQREIYRLETIAAMGAIIDGKPTADGKPSLIDTTTVGISTTETHEYANFREPDLAS